MVSPEFDPYDEEYFMGLGDSDKCHLCGGTGEINALTNQDYIFVANYAECPLCDGSGEAA